MVAVTNVCSCSISHDLAVLTCVCADMEKRQVGIPDPPIPGPSNSASQSEAVLALAKSKYIVRGLYLLRARYECKSPGHAFCFIPKSGDHIPLDSGMLDTWVEACVSRNTVWNIYLRYSHSIEY